MDRLKRVVKRIPVVRDVARRAMRLVAAHGEANFNSADFWETRYREGKSSGPGSYNRLAIFKANTINRFVADRNVQSVIEFGCGDGSQLRLAEYPRYIGVDVSPTIIATIKRSFSKDHTKMFIHLNKVGHEHCSELSMSLDVIYHLVEDDVFEQYMSSLFEAARRYVIVYSSNTVRPSDSIHVRHRRFTDWIERNRTDFRQIDFVKNPYPEDIRDIDNTSFANFYFFERVPDASQA